MGNVSTTGIDLVIFSDGTYDYSLHIQGSDVGLSTNNEDIDALQRTAEGHAIGRDDLHRAGQVVG